jgi:hypothetical protein
VFESIVQWRAEDDGFDALFRCASLRKKQWGCEEEINGSLRAPGTRSRVVTGLLSRVFVHFRSGVQRTSQNQGEQWD